MATHSLASGVCAIAPLVCTAASVAVIPSTAKPATLTITPHTDLFMLPLCLYSVYS
jgi:hypothetical protein